MRHYEFLSYVIVSIVLVLFIVCCVYFGKWIDRQINAWMIKKNNKPYISDTDKLTEEEQKIINDYWDSELPDDIQKP